MPSSQSKKYNYNPDKSSWPWTGALSFLDYDQSINWPKISIVTPSYNQGIFLEETILSILNQNYPNLEYIIIDGASSDNSIDIVKKYKKYLKYWVSEKDEGQTHAINKGLLHCNGQIFNWINSDDILLPHALKHVAMCWLKTQASIVSADCEIQDLDKNSLYISISKIPKNICDFIPPGKVILNQPSTFLDMRIFNKIRYLNQNLHFAMDWECYFNVFLFLLQEPMSAKIDIPLSRAKFYEGTKTSQGWSNFELEILEIVQQSLPKLNRTELKVAQKYLDNKAFQTRIEYTINNKKGLSELITFILRNPVFLSERMFWGAIRKIIFDR